MESSPAKEPNDRKYAMSQLEAMSEDEEEIMCNLYDVNVSRRDAMCLIFGVNRENRTMVLLGGLEGNAAHLGVKLDRNVRLAALDGRIIENEQYLNAVYRDWKLLEAEMTAKGILRYMDLEDEFEFLVERSMKPPADVGKEQQESYPVT